MYPNYYGKHYALYYNRSTNVYYERKHIFNCRLKRLKIKVHNIMLFIENINLFLVLHPLRLLWINFR